MATTPRDNVLDWLRDAHGMEQQAESMLTAQAERLENYPDLRARIQQHIEETRWQQQQLEACISRLGGSTSTVKDLTGKLMAFGQGIVGMTMTDEVVKGALSGYVFENMEIASYTILIAAAEAVGDTATRDTCAAILNQEVAMARWLLEHLGPVTETFLLRDQTPGVQAKR
ncbi:ferritin-like domain-containing protein [Uliginosibacterium sp. sgz301328]|uniref:ferritin-like domain-containing protein n=1 Tax=Uliginosibacterium sp. sgz301328 TaxID=3243764 RepID=UPI00359EFA1F